MSNSTESLKAHLTSVKKTRKITNALYLMSTARLRSELPKVEYRNTYIQRLAAALDTLTASAEIKKVRSPFLEKNKDLPVSLLIVTGDKGLCGSYNEDVITAAGEVISEKRSETGIEPLVYGFGKTSKELLTNAGFKVEKIFEGSASHPVYEVLSDIAAELTDGYKNKKTGEIILLCNSAARQGREPTVTRLLPLTTEGGSAECGNSANVYTEKRLKGMHTVFEPDINSVFERVTESFVKGTLYSLVTLSALSENGARMDAMKAATDNADEMSEKLEKEMNAQRQLSVTNEITEIAASTAGQAEGR